MKTSSYLDKSVLILCFSLFFSFDNLSAQTNTYGLKFTSPKDWKVVDQVTAANFISVSHPEKSASIYITAVSGTSEEVGLKVTSFIRTQAKLAGVNEQILTEDFIDENLLVQKDASKGLNFLVFEKKGEAKDGEEGWTLIYITKYQDKTILFGAVERYKTGTSPLFKEVIRTAMNSIVK